MGAVDWRNGGESSFIRLVWPRLHTALRPLLLAVATCTCSRGALAVRPGATSGASRTIDFHKNTLCCLALPFTSTPHRPDRLESHPNQILGRNGLSKQITKRAEQRIQIEVQGCKVWKASHRKNCQRIGGILKCVELAAEGVRLRNSTL